LLPFNPGRYNEKIMSAAPAPAVKFKLWPTLLAVGLILVIGTIIIILDWDHVKLLSGNADWRFIFAALGFTALAYFLGAASFVLMLRLFEVRLEWAFLMRVSWVSIVQHNLIAFPAALSFRLLLLGGCGVDSSRTVGASLLLVYFKDLALFALIPFSMLFVVLSGNFSSGGVATILTIGAVVAVGVIVIGFIFFNRRLRGPVLGKISDVWRRLFRRDISASVASFEEVMDNGLGRLRRKKRAACMLAGLILGDVAATIATLWFCFNALGIPVQPGVLVAGFNLGVTLAVIPFVPTQLGFQDASMAGVFALFGVPFSYGILGSILFRATFYFMPFIASLPLYWHTVRETARRACLVPPADGG
jgi:uncharacterized protein (TIRG00374 family)